MSTVEPDRRTGVTPVATKMKDLEGWAGRASLYRLDPPWSDDPNMTPIRYVVVSAATAMISGPETYIFEADKNGGVKSFSEMEGSFRGGLDHITALNDLERELARLSGTNFFRDKPEHQTRSSWLYRAAKREAARFGQEDYLANHYARVAAFARMQEVSA